MIKGLGLDDNSMSNLTSTVSGDTSISSSTRNDSSSTTMLYPQQPSSSSQPPPPTTKKKRNLPGNPDPDAEVIALSPKSLLATNRFICEICNKGFQRDQNLQLHRRGHNLPWKLKQRANKDQIKKKVYVCPEPSCVHHDPSRALGDLTGIKKHFCRKHGEKKWKCQKCSKKYAVQSDWKAHSKICGTREYRCDCGTLFSRRDSFITHRAFCDALAEESARAINPITLPQAIGGGGGNTTTLPHHLSQFSPHLSSHHHALLSLPLKREHDQHLHFDTRQEVPPWLLASQPPQQIAFDDQSGLGQGSSMAGHPQLDSQLFSSFQQYNYHQHQNQHDPSPSLSHARPTLSSFEAPPPPQMSATALLQKATEIGVAVNNQYHHQHQHHQQQNPISSHVVMVNNNNNNNNKPQEPHTHMSSLGSSSSREENHHHHHHHHLPHQGIQTNTNNGFIEGQQVDIMMMNNNNITLQNTATVGNGSFDTTPPWFNNFHPNQLHHSMAAASKQPPLLDGGKASTGGGGGGGSSDGMTRDFLGLRTFSHKDFLNMAAGLGHMSSSSPSFDQQQQQQHQHHQNNQTPW